MTEGSIWPLGLAFLGNPWTPGAWCELRGRLRAFRLDRGQARRALAMPLPDVTGRCFRDCVADASGG